MHAQDAQTEQNTFRFIEFIDAYPQLFIEYCITALQHPVLSASTAVILRKNTIKQRENCAFNRSSAQTRQNLVLVLLQLLAQQKESSYVQKWGLVENIIENSLDKLYADCVSQLTVQLLALKEPVNLVFSFIQQALESDQILAQKAAGEMIAEITEYNLGVLANLDCTALFGFVKKLIDLPSVVVFGVKAICNLLANHKNVSLPGQMADQLITELFKIVEATKNDKQLEKMVESIHQLMEDNITVFESHMVVLLQLSQCLMQKDQQNLFDLGVVIFEDVCDLRDLEIGYTGENMEFMLEILRTCIFPSLEKVDDQLLVGFTSFNDPHNAFDQDSNEVMILQCLTRVLGKIDQAWGCFIKFSTYQSWQNIYASLWIMTGFIKSDCYMVDNIKKISYELKTLAANIQQYNPLIQYKVYENIECIIKLHKEPEILLYHLVHLDQIIGMGLNNCSTQGIVAILDLLNTILTVSAYENTAQMNKILTQLPELLQHPSLVIQGLTLKAMGTALFHSQSESIEPYLPYVLPQIQSFIGKAPFVTPNISQLEAEYFINLTNFICQVLQSYEKFPEVRNKIQQIVHHLVELIQSGTAYNVPNLTQCLIKFIAITSVNFPLVFLNYLEPIAQCYLEIIDSPQQQASKTTYLFDVEPGNSYMGNMTELLKLVYRSLAVLFMVLPQKMQMFAPELQRAILNRGEMGRFSFCDQACALATVSNAFFGREDATVQIQQTQQIFLQAAGTEMCAAVLESVFHDYKNLARIAAQKQIDWAEFSGMYLEVLFTLVVTGNRRFERFLFEEAKDKTVQDIDHERDEMCCLGITVGRIAEALIKYTTDQQLKDSLIHRLFNFCQQTPVKTPPLQFYIIMEILKYVQDAMAEVCQQLINQMRKIWKM